MNCVEVARIDYIFSVRRFNKPGVNAQEKIILFGYPCIYMFNVLTINLRVVKVLAAILYAVSELACSNVFGKDWKPLNSSPTQLETVDSDTSRFVMWVRSNKPGHNLCRNSLKAFIRLGLLVVIGLYEVPFKHAVEHNSGTSTNTGSPTIYVTKRKSLYESNEWFQNMNAGNVNAFGDWVFLLGIRIYFSNNIRVVCFRV